MLTVVRREHAGVVSRRGRHHRLLQPGVRLVVPLLDRVTQVDLRQREQVVAPFLAADRDGTPIEVGLRLVWTVKDPVAATDEVADLPGGIEQLATAGTRNHVAGRTAEQLKQGQDLADHLGWVLGEAGVRWGVVMVLVDVRWREPGTNGPPQ